MKEQLEQLKRTFHDIFQSDQAELDFGIYRIMRQKRAEFDRYLEEQLLKDLAQSFKRWQAQTSEGLQEQIKKAVGAAIELGYDPDTAPKVRELRELLENVKYRESLEEGVLSDLVEFLRRYYKEGDFLSLPRYRKNSYAIEYNGEEVKLHWANADQYYVKTAERFRDYRFRLADGKAVHFKIKAANTEAGNNKAESGKERRFQLVEGEFMREENSELLIFFRYEQDEQKRKQADINKETAQLILQESDGFLEWRKVLGEFAPTEGNKERTVLDKHLGEYTARNTFDYFIHKNLEGFLRRELDFYIKNEIVRLDDIENEDAPRVELYLAKVKALRRVGHKLIAFLAQIENFQKKLFLKKKFVVRTDYCVTLDRVPPEMWADVLQNDAQIEEWRRLYAIDEIEANLFNGVESGEDQIPKTKDQKPLLNKQFLDANQNLVIDTRHFPNEWKIKLLSSFEDLDAATDGVLIKADNFHALNLLQEKYREAVKCIYIDPPYNTDASPINYKNGYKNSSWICLIDGRLSLSRDFLPQNGVIAVAIDDTQQKELNFILSSNFQDALLGTVSLRANPSGRPTQAGFSVSHEYVLFAGKSAATIGRMPPTEKQLSRFSENDNLGKFEWRNLRREGSNSDRQARRFLYYPIFVNGANLRVPQMVWNEINEEWKIKEKPQDNEEVVYPIDDDGNEKTWRWGHEKVIKSFDQITVKTNKSGRKQIYYKRRPHEEGVVSVTTWFDAKYSATEHGTSLLKDLFGKSPFSYPKSIYAVQDSIYVSGASAPDTIILDFFAGSGTTAHAVINLNREDGGNRKYILVETNEYFDTVTLPRVKKVVYAKKWKDGKPAKREGSSHVVQYFVLESYEDAMNNLELRRTKEQEQGLLNFTNEFREDYLLNYMLEFEANGSQSLLNLDNFAAPFDYRMKIAVNGVGETQETAVDLVETFNYLIGLHVQKIQQIDGFRVVRGTTRKGERCLILWRTTKELNQELADKRLNDFLEKANFDFSETDTLYINGDAAIPVGNVRKETDTWQVKMIEAEFLRRMFDE